MSNLFFRLYTGHLPRFVYQTNDIKTTSYVMQLKEQTGHQFDISKNLDSLSLSNEIRQESGKEIVVLLFTESNHIYTS